MFINGFRHPTLCPDIIQHVFAELLEKLTTLNRKDSIHQNTKNQQ